MLPKVRRIHILIVALGLALCAIPFRAQIRAAIRHGFPLSSGKLTIADRIKEFGPAVHHRLDGRFAELGIQYPPQRMILVGLKEERMLEVWVSNDAGNWRLLNSYPILGVSGEPGPKLREGDGQMPEGLYKIESLNPNSQYHLSLRVNYPNDFDKEKARLDGRDNLGSDIMIHGNAVSVGCYAIGDEAAEDLFVMATEVGLDKIELILAPADFRSRSYLVGLHPSPAWLPELYARIKNALAPLKAR